MKKILALVLAAALVLALVPMTAMAAEVPIPAGSDAKANGDALKTAIKAAADGDVIILEEGTYDTGDGIITRNTTDNTMSDITIRGAGIGKTIIKGSQYRGFTPQHDDPNSVAEVTIEGMTIQGVRQPIYVKGNITVNLKNVKLENIGTSTTAILLDSCNVMNDGQLHDGITTTVNAYGVEIADGDKIEINANPTNNGGEYETHTTYGYFNVKEGCNFDASDCYVQSPSIGYNNIFVNGECINRDPSATPIPEEAPIPETGDGMGIFVFAGLAIISMLGMAVMKKREF